VPDTAAPTTAGSERPSATTAPATPAPDAPASSTPAPDVPASTAAGSEDPGGFAWRTPPTGEPILIGMVNTEGTPGLDFPEMRTDTDLAVKYLNAHGGFGGRPIEIEHCAVNGSPETSQACAQELVGKGVELVMLGLDLFPGYATYTASDVPVVGALPILPPDYTADALFVTGGNLTTMAAMVALAVEHFQASTAGIISADNPGSNGSEASLTAALDKAGISYVSIKGSDNETDAGFQGLVREATKDDPDIMFSLYSDAGCIGAMRARVLLGVTTPAVSTPICASGEVIDVVGDDAVGWNFVAIGSPRDTPTATEFDTIVALGHDDVATSLGLGALGIQELMTLARVANHLADNGAEVTGRAVYDELATTTELRAFPNDTPLACGSVAAYPSVCNFEFPIGEYVAGGEIRTIPGFESISVVDYLP
jgi:branched-chain amino acid transport system substrate-binding protein